MNSMAFSLLASRNPEVDKIQIPFETLDFQPHQSSFTQVFESMDQDMDLTIKSLNFRVGSLGSIHLSDPAKPGPSASEPKTVAMSESSEGSSSKVNSSVSLAEIEERKIAGGDEIMENFDLEVQLEDLMICHDDTCGDPAYHCMSVTQHTTACCSMQVVDITLAEQASTDITSLRMVQQKHCGPKFKLNFIILQTKA
jgi:hypothetical protein